MDETKTWVAIGEKHGGHAAVVGAQQFNGIVMRMSDPTHLWGLSSDTLWQAGVGLGGGIQGVIMFFFDVDDPQNETIGNGGFDPALDISIGERWAPFFNSLRTVANGALRAPAMAVYQQIRQSGISVSQVADMARVLSLLKDTPNLAASLAGKGIVAFDIPGVGAGLNLSLTVYSGRARLDRYAISSTARQPRRGNIHYARGFAGALLGITTDVTIMTEQDRNRFIEGINHYSRLNAVSWRDQEHRTLLQHIMNQYFRDQPNMRTETRTTYISREELASRMAQFLDQHPDSPIESGWY